MPEPLPSSNEYQRLGRLGSLGLSTVDAMPSLDGFTAELAHLLRIDMAAVALVLEHEQVFIAKHGLDAKRGPRSSGICTHALVQPEQALIIPDALYDPRVMDSPLVLAQPRIRAYAGRPLCLEPGFAIGTLCAFGPTPRDFSAADRRHLDRIAASVVDEIRRFLASGRLH